MTSLPSFGRGVSVVVPCYNSETPLPETLASLARQRVPRSVAWEVIVVDNASTDGTAEVATRAWQDLSSLTPLRVVREPRKGLAAARGKGFRSSRFEYVLFCDDDNRLDEKYVRTVHEIMSGNEAIGVLGGWGRAESTIPLPDWFDKFGHRFAVGPQAEAPGDITDTRGWLYGAGFVVRHSAWEALQEAGFQHQMSGRNGRGQDKELCYAVRLAGFRIWYDDRLTFEHRIAAERLTWDYLTQFIERQHHLEPISEAYATVLEPNDGEGGAPRQCYWLERVSSKVRSLVSRGVFKILVMSRMRSRRPRVVGSGTAARFHREKGAILGWLRMRSRFIRICNDIQVLKENLSPAAESVEASPLPAENDSEVPGSGRVEKHRCS